MKYTRVSIGVLVLLVGSLPVWAGGAQELPDHRRVGLGDGPIELDGMISDQEYTERYQSESIAVYLTRLDEDTLQVAVEAAGDGWVSLGFGSEKMDGSRMLIGFVQDSTASFQEHLGSGWSHSQHDSPVVLDSAVTRTEPPNPELPPTTMLEARLPASAVEVNGRGQAFPVIFAVGPQPNFTARHTYRGSEMLQLD